MKKKLLKQFGSVRGVSAAGETDLRAVVGPLLASRIRAHINRQE